MKDRLIVYSGWIRSAYYGVMPWNISRIRLLVVVLSAFMIHGSASALYAQSEDTTRTEREIPEPSEKEDIPSPDQTPYHIDILESDIHRYQLKDYGSSHRFYRRLESLNAEDFLLSEQEGYERYGAEWERKINEDLRAILEATFKEESDFMKLLGRIAPFLRFGFFEPYEVPITRVEHPDKVDVIEE